MDDLTSTHIAEAISQGGSGNADIVGALENAFGDLVGARYALCTSSGTAALICALRAVGVQPGDPVAVSALAPAMTALAITSIGAHPVFCDTAGPLSFGICPDAARRAVDRQPKAAVLVPMWGYWDEPPSTLDTFRQHGVPIIVDAAQAPFLRLHDGLCRVADIVCLSLHARKPFKAGEGGVCLTDHHSLAAGVVQVRNFGQGATTDGRRLIPTGAFGANCGTNFKINALGAAWCLTQVQAAEQRRIHLTALAATATEMLTAPGISWTPAAQSTAVAEHGRYGIVAICPTEDDATRLAAALAGAGVDVDTSRYRYRPTYHAPHLAPYATACTQAEQVTRTAVGCRLEAFTSAYTTAFTTSTGTDTGTAVTR